MRMKTTVIKKYRKQQGGFSLIEILVSVSIFAVVVTMSVGTLIVLIDANAKAQNVQAVVNNVAFALDSMVRDIRTGYDYGYETVCGSISFSNNADPHDCPNGASIFAFTESGGSLTGPNGACGAPGCGSNRIGFRLNNGAIERRLGSNGSWQPLTADDVTITTLDFVVTGTDVGALGNSSPLVTIFIAGEAGDIEGVDSSFSLQTTVTQQTLDL